MLIEWKAFAMIYAIFFNVCSCFGDAREGASENSSPTSPDEASENAGEMPTSPERKSSASTQAQIF